MVGKSDRAKVSQVYSHIHGAIKEELLIKRRHHYVDIENSSLIALHAAPGQGLSEYVRANIRKKHGINCNPNLKRRNIYKLLLSMWGYEVKVQSRRKKKISALASINLLGQSANTQGAYEKLVEAMSINVDLTDPAEVCHLINKKESNETIMLFNFDRLSIKTQMNILDDLCYFKDTSNLRFVLAISSNDSFYLEKINDRASSAFQKIQISYWSESELADYLSKVMTFLGWKMPSSHKDKMLNFAAGDVTNLNFCLSKLLEVGAELTEATAPEFSDFLDENIQEYYSEVYSGKLRKFLRDKKFFLEYKSQVIEAQSKNQTLSGKLLDSTGAALTQTTQMSHSVSTNAVNISFNQLVFEFLLEARRAGYLEANVSDLAEYMFASKMVNPDRPLPDDKVAMTLRKLNKRQSKYRFPNGVVWYDAQNLKFGLQPEIVSVCDRLGEQRLRELVNEPYGSLEDYAVPEGWRELWRGVEAIAQEDAV